MFIGLSHTGDGEFLKRCVRDRIFCSAVCPSFVNWLLKNCTSCQHFRIDQSLNRWVFCTSDKSPPYWIDTKQKHLIWEAWLLLKLTDGFKNPEPDDFLFFCGVVSWNRAQKRKNDLEEVSGINISDWLTVTFCVSQQIARSCLTILPSLWLYETLVVHLLEQIPLRRIGGLDSFTY